MFFICKLVYFLPIPLPRLTCNSPNSLTHRSRTNWNVCYIQIQNPNQPQLKHVMNQQSLAVRPAKAISTLLFQSSLSPCIFAACPPLVASPKGPMSGFGLTKPPSSATT